MLDVAPFVMNYDTVSYRSSVPEERLMFSSHVYASDGKVINNRKSVPFSLFFERNSFHFYLNLVWGNSNLI